MLKKSRPYVAILLGGYPSGADKVMELVADHNKHLNFIYGFGVFVLYFHSKKRLKYIKEVFITTLKNELDMVFVFEDNSKSIRFITPRLQEKISMADMHRKNAINNDLVVLREILFMLGVKYNSMAAPMPYIMDNEATTEQAVSDKQILDELLDKMKNVGYESLSPSEKDFLKQYKDKHSKDEPNDQTDVD